MSNQNQPMTQEQMAQELTRLQEENAKLKNKAVGGLKVSPKGAVSCYGLGRFPITLYAAQWESLFERIEDIKQFIVTHNAKLTRKPAKADDGEVEVA